MVILPNVWPFSPIKKTPECWEQTIAQLVTVKNPVKQLKHNCTDYFVSPNYKIAKLASHLKFVVMKLASRSAQQSGEGTND